jgi:inner membrane protein
MFILGGLWRSTIIATVILALYGYLYVLLMNQDYALLIGSICLFLVLATVMFITRRLDWYAYKNAGKVEVKAPGLPESPVQGA